MAGKQIKISELPVGDDVSGEEVIEAVQDGKSVKIYLSKLFSEGPAGDSAYQVAVKNGYVGTASQWLASLKGGAGSAGKSAYQSAVDAGYVGTEPAWVASLTGKNGSDGDAGIDGRSAYEIARDNGYVGTEAQWLQSLVGTKGDNGASAYQVALQNGFTGTESQWLLSLVGTKGSKGDDGDQGPTGKSAYQIATDFGFTGTIGDWLTSLKGKDGTSITIKGSLSDPSKLPASSPLGAAYIIAEDVWIMGDSGWFDAGKFLGEQGADGKSAYQVAVSEGFVGTEAEWLATLQGDAGASAYQVAVANGFSGTVTAWLASLKGKDGTSISIKGTLTDQSKLPTGAALGDAYIISGDVWIMGNTGWFDAGKFLGEQGDPGLSAYQVAVKDGFTGTEAEWLASLQGPAGPAGNGSKEKLLVRMPWQVDISLPVSPT